MTVTQEEKSTNAQRRYSKVNIVPPTVPESQTRIPKKPETLDAKKATLALILSKKEPKGFKDRRRTLLKKNKDSTKNTPLLEKKEESISLTPKFQFPPSQDDLLEMILKASEAKP